MSTCWVGCLLTVRLQCLLEVWPFTVLHRRAVPRPASCSCWDELQRPAAGGRHNAYLSAAGQQPGAQCGKALAGSVWLCCKADMLCAFTCHVLLQHALLCALTHGVAQTLECHPPPSCRSDRSTLWKASAASRQRACAARRGGHAGSGATQLAAPPGEAWCAAAQRSR